MSDEEVKVAKSLSFRFANKKIKQPFVIGGDWDLADKANKVKTIKVAKKENYEHFDNKYSGVVIEKTSDINEYEGYGLFEEFPKNANSMALAHALYCMNERRANEQGAVNLPIIRFFHLRDDGGKEIVWVTVVVDEIVREDRIISSLSSFQVETDLKAEYANESGEVDFKRFKVNDDEGLKELERIWLSLSKKQKAQTLILSFTGNIKRLAILGAVVVVLAGAALYGWHWYDEYQAEQRLIEEKLAAEADAARRIESLKRSEFPPVWIDEPTPAQFMAGVETIIRKTPLIVNGWEYAGVSFSVNKAGTELQASVAYKRGQKAPYMVPPGRISIQKPFQTLVPEKYRFKKQKREVGIMKRKNAEMWLLQLSLGKPYKTTFSLEDSPSKTINVGSSSIEIIASYQTIRVQITELYHLGGLGKELDAPGFVINSLSQTNGKWKLSGTLYVLP